MKLFSITSIKKRLLIVFLPLIIITNLLTIIIVYRLYAQEIDQASYRHAEQTVDIVNQHLETYVEELERLSLFPYFHTEVMDILTNESHSISPKEKYAEYKFFEDVFNHIMLYPRQDLLNVTLYREDGRQYFNTRVNVSLNIDYDWKDSKWYQRTLNANGGATFTNNIDQDKRFKVLHHDIFLISRLIKSEQGDNLGVVLIDANFQGIIEILQTIGLGNHSNVILRNEEGEIIFSKNELYVDQVQQAGEFGSQKVKVDQGAIFVASKLSEKTDWEINVVIHSDEISNSYTLIRGITLFVLSCLGLITILVTFWFSKGIVRPILELDQKMKLVEKGNYDVPLQVNKVDEIGSLGRTFNRMRTRIKELIHEVYEFNIRQKEAELNNLKLQIRPHFLYNTLEAIRSLAEIKNNHEIVKMTTSLGSILRYSIRTHEKLVPLRKELDYVQQYLNIQKVMFGDTIKINCDIESNILDYLSIPLLFQPIVENAFQHGLYGKQQGGIVSISGKKTDDQLLFTISDNGKGIELNRLKRINEHLQHLYEDKNERNEVGIGLANVNQRIKIAFGESYGISVESVENVKTSIIIKIPIIQDDDH